MFRLQVILFFLWLPVSVGAQIHFFKVLGTNNSDEGVDLITTQENGYAVLLNSPFNAPLNSRVNLGIVKTDVVGAPLYTSEVIVDSSCVGKKILELSNKDLFVLGTATHGSFMSSNKLFLMKTNNTGTPIWCYHYASTTSDQAVDMIPTRDGNFLILGTSNYNINYEEVLVIKINPGGGVIWSKRISAPAHELTANSIKEFDNGDIVIGSTLSTSGFLDVALIKLNNSGNLIWNRVYATTYDDELQKIVINAANEIYMAGHSYIMSSEWDMFVAKVDSGGTLQFEYFYDGGSYNGEKIRDMELAAGRIALIGDIGTFDERNMFLTSIYTDGSIYFGKQYPYMINYTNYPFGLEIVNNNEYAFTGDVFTNLASREAGLIKTDAMGNLGCYTANLQFNLTNETFTPGNINIVITNDNIIKADLVHLLLVPNVYPKTICEYIPPIAAFDTITFTNVCPYHCYSFTDTSLYDPVTWKWYFEGADPDTSTQQNPANICWNNSGNYSIKLVVTNAYGSDSTTHQLNINLDCPIHIPNVFTPNNDGQNDVFDINGLPENFELVIYNRWGTRVFETVSPDIMWNGKIENNGGTATDGVYYYVLNDYSNHKKYSSFLSLFH